jgi:gamma-glutamyltranspeptidase/glutathione hydrolase
MVDCVQSACGILSEEDLNNFQAQWVEPISIEYKEGVRFHEIPPNGQGLTALIALNIMKGYDIERIGFGTADYWHLLIESMKLAFADASKFIGDPNWSEIPLSVMLSDDYTDIRRSMISMDRAQMPVPGNPSHLGDTVYISTADRYGNMVSWIQSLYMSFGSGLTAGSTGILLQNRGANFVLAPGHPNQVAPGKRPYHTIIPGFITRNDEAWCSFGVMGGFMQPQGHLQVGLNLVDFELDPQTALDAPRFRWLENNKVALEPAISHETIADLLGRGHEI